MILIRNRKVLSIILLLIPFFAFAQQKKVGKNVIVDYEEVSPSSNDSSKIVLDKLKDKKLNGGKYQLNDSLINIGVLGNIGSPDLNLGSMNLENPINKEFIKNKKPETVFSRKEWMKSPDSLFNLKGVNMPVDFENLDIPTVPLGEEDLVGILNSKLESERKPEVVDASQIKKEAEGQMTTEGQAMLSEIKVKDLKLEDPKLSELPSIPSDVIDSKHLKSIDSLRDINLDLDKLKFDETKISEKVKVADFKQKANFWDKSYLDGIIGFYKDEEFVLQASPALAYYLTENLSIGAGPNLNLKISETETKANIGLRSLIKYEVLKKRVYGQFENTVSDISYNAHENNKLKLSNQSTLIGAGYILPIKTRLTLNFALFYQLSGSPTNEEMHPFVLRIGISSIKK